MKPFIKTIVIMLVIVLISAILAPALYRVLPFKFERIFNRIVMIGTLIAVALFVRIRRDTFVRYGLIWDRSNSLRFLIQGFLAGIVILSLVAVVKVAAGDARFICPTAGIIAIGMKTVGMIATAFFIGLLEEFFFRGFVLGLLSDSYKKRFVLSLLVTNIFYALLHFVSFKKPFVGPEPTFWDSLRLAAVPFMQVQYLPQYWPQALGLFLFGLVLSVAFLRSKSLYAAIGLHAGCIFFVKMDSLFVEFYNKKALFFSSEKMYDGLVGWTFLILLGWLIQAVLKPSKNAAEA